jgi:transcriptional regulator with XRE-family HTH domain
VAEHVRTAISYQIRALRAQRGWSQKKLSEEIKKPQSVVNRLENPDYGRPSVQTLLEIAAAFDVALLIQYVSFPEFLRRTRDVSPESMCADSFDAKQLYPLAAIYHQGATAEVVVGRYSGWQVTTQPAPAETLRVEASAH